MNIETSTQHRLAARELHARRRLDIELNGTSSKSGGSLVLSAVARRPALRWLVQSAFRASGLHGRGVRNARRIEVRHHDAVLPRLPEAFHGYTVLQLSDLHVDFSQGAMARLEELLPDLSYDLCVLTGDYRGPTFGPYRAALEGLARVRELVDTPVYAVLGNHDTIQMVPDMEEMGIRVLLNECETISRGGEEIFLAGVDDASNFRLHDIERAAAGIPGEACSLLLSHTPEVYAQAAGAGFDLVLCGHTHGGQVCLPGSVPVITLAASPRHMASGSWRHGTTVGYTATGVGTSLMPIRLNCPPEITLHRLLSA